jgi:hypothetical protein
MYDHSGKFGFGKSLLTLLLIENSPSLILNWIYLYYFMRVTNLFQIFLTNTGGSWVKS